MALRVERIRSALAGPFSFALAPGECLAITGPSGSGKTLLLRMVADLDPHDGDVSLDGVRRSDLPAATWRSQVGFLPARCGWWDERIDTHFAADTQDGRFPLATALLLPGAIFERGVDQASTGERQRLGLIRALLAQPRVLLLDEPTASLDPVATAAVESLLMARRALGMSLVIVTHDVAQAKRMGHEHRHMRDGALVPA